MDDRRATGAAGKPAGDSKIADTLEGLRLQVEELIGRLAQSENEARASGGRDGWPPPAGPDPTAGDVEAEIETLGSKVDAASELLASLTDLLEAQTDRIETIEDQLEAFDAEPTLEDPVLTELEARIASLEGRQLSDAPVDGTDDDPTDGPVREPARRPGPVPAETGNDARLAGIEEIVEREVRASALGAPDSHPTVLVVDDSADARTILSLYLSKTGYQVVTASSAEDCLAKLLRHEIDVVVLDPRLSGAGGDHVLRVIGEESSYAGKRCVPVIVYTAYPDELGPQRARELGAADYVLKGGDMLPLVTALVRHAPTRTIAGNGRSA